MNALVVSITFLCASPLLPGQAAVQRQQPSVSDLIQQGHLETAISILERDLKTANRPDATRARSLSLLGYAYKQEGKFDLAEYYFDRALRLMDAAGDWGVAHASTLDFYAGTLMSTGDFESAAKALRKGALIDARIGNHAGLALIFAHTAELDIGRKKFNRATKELEGARSEAFLDPSLGTKAEIDGATGWLAVAKGQFREAVVAYSTSLDESRRQFGDHDPVTGWSYILLGNAQDLDHDQAGAEASFAKGLRILEETVGSNNIQYLLGQLAYSAMLDHAGSSTAAARIRSIAQQSMRSQGLLQCTTCTVSVGALRYEGER